MINEVNTGVCGARISCDTKLCVSKTFRILILYKQNCVLDHLRVAQGNCFDVDIHVFFTADRNLKVYKKPWFLMDLTNYL